ncbi:ABC transporter permease [Aquimarina sp. I32.4]|uniref:ABC transporter permease n=1 Tax=Aquimarina sp. I32.4 TaxID=2053903 RepID=UPI000CDEEC82|nr:FtsX-like permease family protein [Aquimarina sp. I32.4]
MNIFLLAIKNSTSKMLSTSLSCILLALSIGLLLFISQINKALDHQLQNNFAGIDMVVGAKGSPLQLVLSSVFHIDNPTGNITYDEYTKLKKHPWTKEVVPISLGDNYNGYRIIGTTANFASLYKTTLEKGKNATNPMEVVLGSQVAEQSKLTLGDKIHGTHGLLANQEGGKHEEHMMIVVGIYQSTGKVIDRLITTPLETIWMLHHEDTEDGHTDHEEQHHDPHKEEHHSHEEEHHNLHEEEHHSHEGETHIKEVTALLVSFRNPRALLMLPRHINDTTGTMAALPKFEMDKLTQTTGIGTQTIQWIAYIILGISVLSIFIHLYKTIKERSYELALMRTYGASRWQLVQLVGYEGILITTLGLLLGILCSQIGLSIMFTVIENQYKQSITTIHLYIDIIQVSLILALVISIVILFAMYPITKMDISKILSHEN